MREETFPRSLFGRRQEPTPVCAANPKSVDALVALDLGLRRRFWGRHDNGKVDDIHPHLGRLPERSSTNAFIRRMGPASVPRRCC